MKIRHLELLALAAVVLGARAERAESARTSVARDFPVYDNGGLPDLTIDPLRFVNQMEIVWH